jgi:hypothetical protein
MKNRVVNIWLLIVWKQHDILSVGPPFSGGLLLSVQDSASAEEVEPVTQPDPGPGSDTTSNILSSGECGRVVMILVYCLNSIVCLHFVQNYRSIVALFLACVVLYYEIGHYVHLDQISRCFILSTSLEVYFWNPRYWVDSYCILSRQNNFISKLYQLDFPYLCRIDVTTILRENCIWSWVVFISIMLGLKRV